MSDPDIIEAAARAVRKAAAGDLGEQDSLLLATAALTAAKPLIRAAALEEAAKVAENYPAAMNTAAAWDVAAIAAAVRALKEQP